MRFYLSNVAVKGNSQLFHVENYDTCVVIVLSVSLFVLATVLFPALVISCRIYGRTAVRRRLSNAD